MDVPWPVTWGLQSYGAYNSNKNPRAIPIPCSNEIHIKGFFFFFINVVNTFEKQFNILKSS